MVNTANAAQFFAHLLAAAGLPIMQPDDALDALRPIDPDSSARIDACAALMPGWLEEDSVPIAEDARHVAAAVLLVYHSQPRDAALPPFVAPLADGGIEIDCRTAGGREIMLEVPPTGDAVHYLKAVVAGGEAAFAGEGSIPADSPLSDVLAWFAAEQP